MLLYRVCFQHFIYTIMSLLGLFCCSHLTSSSYCLHYFFLLYYCCKMAFSLLAGQQSSRDLERWRQRKDRGEENKRRRGVRLRWTVGLLRGLLLPRRHREGFVCVCVSVCVFSRQQRTSLPHHRSIVEVLLPRLTVGPHSHLSPYTDPLVRSYPLCEPTSPLCCFRARVQLSSKRHDTLIYDTECISIISIAMSHLRGHCVCCHYSV